MIDITDEGGGSHPSPEQRLFYAIIMSAVRDLFLKSTGSSSDSDAQRVSTRKEALDFFVGGGSWAQSREDICTIIGVDPDLLKSNIIEILEGERTLGKFDDRFRYADGLELAQALWAERKAAAARHREQNTRKRKTSLAETRAANEQAKINTRARRLSAFKRPLTPREQHIVALAEVV